MPKPKTSAKQSTKTLLSKDAYERFVDHWKLSYTVAKKFYDDHLVKDALTFGNPSRNDILELALKRYKRTNGKINTSSWIVLRESQIIEKVRNSSNKRASVHQGKQQLTVKIKVERSTVELKELKGKEQYNIKRNIQKKVEECKVNKETVRLLCDTKKKLVDINVVGDWKPLTGRVEIYHYDASAALREHQMLRDYLVWKTDELGNPTYPKATK